MRKVLVTIDFNEELLARIAAVSDEIEVEVQLLQGGQWPDDRETDAEIHFTTDKVVDPELAPNMRWLHSHWAGIEGWRESVYWDSDAILTTASGIHAPNMGQYVLAQMLAWANRIPEWTKMQMAAQWPPRRWETFTPDELYGQTLGILGYGSIGREVARLATAFDMEILVTKFDGKHTEDTGYLLPGLGDPEGDLPRRIYPPQATLSMAAECDYLVVTLPLTDETRHSLNESLFRAMKPESYLINVGRGALINEADLIRALQQGWIAGAGLDVFEEEPLPESSKLWALDNVILTPHISGFSPRYNERSVDLFTTNLARYLEKEPLYNEVNRQTGY